MDRECPGDLVCELGECVAPSPAVTARSPVPVSPAEPRAARVSTSNEEGQGVEEVRGKRYSVPLFVTGIVLTSLSGVALVVATSGAEGTNEPVLVGGVVACGVMAGVGIPMIVVGARRVPMQPPRNAAAVTPWITAHGAGLRFGLVL